MWIHGTIFRLILFFYISDPDPNSTISVPRNTNIPNPHTQMPSARPVEDHSSRPVARVTSVQMASIPDDDFDIDHIAAIEAEFDSHGKRPLKDVVTKPEKRLKTEQFVTNTADDYPDDLDCFGDEDEEHLMEIEAQFDVEESYSSPLKGPMVVSSEPFVYIKQINDMKETDRAGRVFRVKAQIMKLLSKLSVSIFVTSIQLSLINHMNLDYRHTKHDNCIGNLCSLQDAYYDTKFKTNTRT